MGQRAWTVEEQKMWKAFYPSLFATGRNSFTGSARRTFEHIWAAEAFHFSMLNFNNVMTDREANSIVYNYWKRKVRERLTDPKKQRLMAPDEASYYFGTKRTPLEHDYYDVLNQDNVEIVDLNKHPIRAFTERGMRLEGEEDERDFDVIVCATGFDSFTGSLTNMGLKNKNGVDMKDKSKLSTMAENTLFPHTNSWWNTSNIPGKKAENQNYILGIPTYEKECREKLEKWQGFEIAA
ncbi:hypothetical protein E8E12_010066 [Didymella heteroderae]|uniref:Monooxygenase n=1 Tax=Didymella heteroderae TaxID=1769908 RepID=A0A9P4WXV3_9PLEO|nr:hypothetical protein E8E12_010066 [Didymella heteroderae]